MPREELQQLQEQKLGIMLEWYWQKSLFWRELAKNSGYRPGERVSLKELSSLPFVTRQHLNENQQKNPFFGSGLFTIEPEEALRYHRTSGTSGDVPFSVLDGRKDWEWVAEMWCYGMYAFGIRSTDRVYVAYGYGTFIGFWGAHYAAEKIGCLTIPGGGLSSSARIKQIIDLEATVLVCTPTYALRLTQVAEEEGINLAEESKIKFLILAGEPGGSIPNTKTLLEKAWGGKVGDFPGMSETGGSTCFECKAQSGGIHILEDHYIQEVINQTGQPVAYGEKGELVITSFGRGSFPLIRYRTGDLVQRVPHDFCTCGRTFDLYQGGILGRADDMKLVCGVNIFPSNLENIIRGYQEISEYQIEIYTQRGMDQIKVRVEPFTKLEDNQVVNLCRSLSEKLYNQHRLTFQVEAMQPGKLPRSELKSKRLIDNRNNNY
jgi:phenylacetate-CoA ligase